MEMVSLNCSECVKREEEREIKFANFIKMMIYANGQGCGFFTQSQEVPSTGCKTKAQTEDFAENQRNRTRDHSNEDVCGCLNRFALPLLNMTANLL